MLNLEYLMQIPLTGWFQNVFQERPIMCLRRSKNLNDFFWTKTIVNNKSQKAKLSSREIYSIPCHVQLPKRYTTSTTNELQKQLLDLSN